MKKFIAVIGLLGCTEIMSMEKNDALLIGGGLTLVASYIAMSNLYGQKDVEKAKYDEDTQAHKMVNSTNLNSYNRAMYTFGGLATIGLIAHRINPNMNSTLTTLALIGTTAPVLAGYNDLQNKKQYAEIISKQS